MAGNGQPSTTAKQFSEDESREGFSLDRAAEGYLADREKNAKRFQMRREVRRSLTGDGRSRASRVSPV